MKETKDATNRWRDKPHSLIEKKKNIVIKTTTQSMPIKLLTAFFLTELETQNLQFLWKHKKAPIGKGDLKKCGAGGNWVDFRLCYEATPIKKVRYWHKSRRIA